MLPRGIVAIALVASAACTSSGACSATVIHTPLHPDIHAPLGAENQVGAGESFQASVELQICKDGGSPFDPAEGRSQVTLGLAQNEGEALDHGGTFERPLRVIREDLVSAEMDRDRAVQFEGTIPDDLDEGVYFFVLEHDHEIRSAPFRVTR